MIAKQTGCKKSKVLKRANTILETYSHVNILQSLGMPKGLAQHQ